MIALSRTVGGSKSKAQQILSRSVFSSFLFLFLVCLGPPFRRASVAVSPHLPPDSTMENVPEAALYVESLATQYRPGPVRRLRTFHFGPGFLRHLTMEMLTWIDSRHAMRKSSTYRLRLSPTFFDRPVFFRGGVVAEQPCFIQT